MTETTPWTERWFPLQAGYRNTKSVPHPLRIPWSVAEKAYCVYVRRYGSGQSLERLAERGGFDGAEMDELYPPWREETSELAAVRQERDVLLHCRTCSGSPHASGLLCVCGGTNLVDEELQGLRLMLIAAEARVAEIKTEWESCCERERARWEIEKEQTARVAALTEALPHLEQSLDPLTQKREGRHVYVVDRHVNPEGPAECRRIGGRCAALAGAPK